MAAKVVSLLCQSLYRLTWMRRDTNKAVLLTSFPLTMFEENSYVSVQHSLFLYVSCIERLCVGLNAYDSITITVRHFVNIICIDCSDKKRSFVSLTSVIITVDLYFNYLYIYKQFFWSFLFFHNYKPVSACRIVYVSNIQQRLSEPPSFINVTDPELSTNPVVNCMMQVFFLHPRSVKCDPCGDLAACGGNWTTGLSIIQMENQKKTCLRFHRPSAMIDTLSSAVQ